MRASLVAKLADISDFLANTSALCGGAITNSDEVRRRE
jgi:hypothetical protein